MFLPPPGFIHPRGNAETNPLLALLKAGGFKLGVYDPQAERRKKMMAQRPADCKMSAALYSRCAQVGESPTLLGQKFVSVD